ncbi:MAG: hypothetical protein ACLSA1_06850 [Alphaproteobacteria bacterium]
MQEYLRQLKIYIKDIAKLALPITTAFVAMGLMGIIDTMIVGNYNTDQLAYIRPGQFDFCGFVYHSHRLAAGSFD